jgi:choice-of-anchor B domain-containing protein
MIRIPRTLASAILLLASATLPLTAQDQFGSAVAVGGDEILVLKNLAGRGPATVFIYQMIDGAWEVVDELLAPGAGETGEGLSSSMSLDGSGLLVGSADPGPDWAAHAFERQGGAWDDGNRIAIDPGSSGATTETSIDLAGVMRILQPPKRVVARDGSRALVAITAGAEAGVRLYEARGGSWSIVAALDEADLGGASLAAASVAMKGDVALVGAAQPQDSGAVFVLGPNPEADGWGVVATLVGPGPDPAGSFGAAVGFDGEDILVGMPGSEGGSVVAFRRDEAGMWSETGSVQAPGGPGTGFGASFAIFGDELWVGAPADADGAGAVYRYERDGSGAPWQADPAGRVTGPESESPTGFGMTIALDEDHASVGAPFVDFGVGRAAAFARGSDGAWGEPSWLEPEGGLETVSGSEIPCADGRAGGFSCDNVDLLAFLPLAALGAGGGESVSDVWGWTDPETGREYALVGRSGGASIVDVTDPSSPLHVGTVTAPPSGARDLKTYSDHLYFTGDAAGEHGLVVFDLTRLRDVAEVPATFEPDTVYRGIASAHNLVIDTEAGFAYPVGASGGGQTCGGGLHMVDIREPTNPTFAGCYTDTEGLLYAGRTHDAQCVIYRGPDENFTGQQICFASNETALRIVDVTDKGNPIPISAATYPRLVYVHQGWLTEDQRYFFMNDELDELVGQADKTRTLVWDVMELDDPLFVGEFYAETGATDHNLYIKGNLMYQANYNAGMEVWDISDPENPVQIGSFDTTPWEGDPPGFNGAWTAYPFFESGTVLVTSIKEGLFLLRPRIILN